jgi:hypothetical protein
MIGTTLSGARCRATKKIQCDQGTIARFTEGTIHFDIENCGRHLLRVEWDNGITDYVSPFEVELIDDEEAINLDATEVGKEKIFWS